MDVTKVRIADTSALYALFSEDDEHHEEAMKSFEETDPIVIPQEIWSETVSLIQYRQGKKEAVEAGEALLDLPHVDVRTGNLDIFWSSWKEFTDSENDLSYPDCVVISWCDDRGASPLSFGRSLNSSVQD